MQARISLLLFLVKLDRCAGSCNTANKACIPNKTEDLNLSVSTWWQD